MREIMSEDVRYFVEGRENPDVERERLRAVKAERERDEALEALRFVEWGGCQQGPGSGLMFSGGDGAMVRACPACKGIDPSDPGASSFTERAQGHRHECCIAEAIAKVEGRAES